MSLRSSRHKNHTYDRAQHAPINAKAPLKADTVPHPDAIRASITPPMLHWRTQTPAKMTKSEADSALPANVAGKAGPMAGCDNDTKGLETQPSAQTHAVV